MPATSDDVARFTSDGLLLTRTDQPTRDRYRAAQEMELETFFVSDAGGKAMLEERFALLAMPTRLHEAIEISDNLGLGTSEPVAPRIPAFDVVDESRALAGRGVIRAYTFDHNTDRYAVELVGAPASGTTQVGKFDSTYVDFSSTVISWDSVQ